MWCRVGSLDPKGSFFRNALNRYVLGADIDQDALAIARTNLQEMELEYEVDLVKMRIQQDSIAVDRFGRIFDTVIMSM